MSTIGKLVYLAVSIMECPTLTEGVTSDAPEYGWRMAFRAWPTDGVREPTFAERTPGPPLRPFRQLRSAMASATK
jgi:hypothetical protein